MHKTILRQTAGLATGLALLLTGCGDSHPIAEPGPAAFASGPAGSAPANSVPVYPPSTGRFVAVAADAISQSAESSAKCNLDAIDGAPPGSKPLSHDGSVLFEGWAASNDGAAVPDAAMIVLLGQQAFEVRVPTGAPRPDVAAANHEPALANAGYAINADMAAVTAGSYTVELRYAAGGKAWRCETVHSVAVE